LNTKKLIGAIIGVIAFVILIAGATFAWLSVTATVNNAQYTGTSKNFVINYQGSANISGFKEIKSGSATTAAITSSTSASVAGDAWAAVTAEKTANDAPANHFRVKLAIGNNTMQTGAIIWAICKGSCPTNTALATVTSSTVTCGTGVTNCGRVAAETSGSIELYDDQTTFNTDAQVSTTTYNVYFWLDSDTLSNDDIGAQFSGYIYAEATQLG